MPTEALKEARSGASTPYRPSGLSSLSRNLSMSLARTSSTAGSEDMRRNIEVACVVQTNMQSVQHGSKPHSICRRKSKSCKNSMLHESLFLR